MAKMLRVKLLVLGFAVLLLFSSFSLAEDEDNDDNDAEGMLASRLRMHHEK